MRWLTRLIEWWSDLLNAWREPLDVWDSDFPESDGSDSGYPQHDFADRIPEGFHPCDTQPTSPGALDTLPGRLE